MINKRMFKNNEQEDFADFNPGVEDTVIGGAIKIEGELVSDGSIVVEGEVIGSIKTAKNLRIGEKAKIKAGIMAHDAYVAGRVDGNVIVDGKLELSATAEVHGDVQAQVVVIAAGAVFNGHCAMESRGGRDNRQNIETNQEEPVSQE